MKPYTPRTCRFHGLVPGQATRLKLYSVVSDESAIAWSSFRPGIDLALRSLPTPTVTDGRPGLGFLIAHQAGWIDYLILGWWDRENELPLRVFVREHEGEGWRPAKGSESVCVWDLEVIWSEREAYVDTVLRAGDVGRAEDYLARYAGRVGEPPALEVVRNA